MNTTAGTARTAIWFAAAAISLFAVAAAAKPPLHGLVSMGRLHFLKTNGVPDNSLREANAHPGVYAGVVILATWAELQPTPGGKIDTSEIDRGLDAVRLYNSQYRATPVQAKLRIFAGRNAPEWAKALGGAPFTLIDRKSGAPFTIGHWWSAPYRAAWRDLQAQLAARYDTNPLVQEVAVSSCSVSTAEPFVLPLDQTNIPLLHAAGYTDAAELACLNGALQDYSPWHNVALDYTFTSLHAADTGRVENRPDLTVQVMDAWRATLGGRGVIANHGLEYPGYKLKPEITAELRKLGPPIEFQALNANVDWDATFRFAQTFGATEFEMWETADAGGPAAVNSAQLKGWAESFK